MSVEALEPGRGRRTRISFDGTNFVVIGDATPKHGGSDEGPNGFDLISAALGHCFLITLLECAEAQGVYLQGVRAVVASKSRLDGLGKAPVISELSIEVILEGAVDSVVADGLLAYAEQLCGVHATLLQMPRIDATVRLMAR